MRAVCSITIWSAVWLFLCARFSEIIIENSYKSEFWMQQRSINIVCICMFAVIYTSKYWIGNWHAKFEMNCYQTVYFYRNMLCFILKWKRCILSGYQCVNGWVWSDNIIWYYYLSFDAWINSKLDIFVLNIIISHHYYQYFQIVYNSSCIVRERSECLQLSLLYTNMLRSNGKCQWLPSTLDENHLVYYIEGHNGIDVRMNDRQCDKYGITNSLDHNTVYK